MSDEADDIPKAPDLVHWGKRGIALIVLLWGGSCGLILLVLGKPDGPGTFGDLFGCINALFSGLAFLGVIVAILLQKQELELQRQELRDQRKEMRESRIAQEKTARALETQLYAQHLTAKIQGVGTLIQSIDQQLLDPGMRQINARSDLQRQRAAYRSVLNELMKVAGQLATIHMPEGLENPPEVRRKAEERPDDH